MSGQSYDYFPQGHQTYGNRIVSQNTHGELINAYAKDNYKNSQLIVMWSGRRDCEVWTHVDEFELDLKHVYKNVASIELLSARVPVCDSVAAKGSFYVHLWANNRPLELVNVADTTRRDLTGDEKDMFSMDGAFAHVLVKKDPTIIHPYKDYRRIFRFMTPLEKLNKLRIALRVYPDPNTFGTDDAPSFCPMPFGDCDEVEFTFEINSQF